MRILDCVTMISGSGSTRNLLFVEVDTYRTVMYVSTGHNSGNIGAALPFAGMGGNTCIIPNSRIPAQQLVKYAIWSGGDGKVKALPTTGVYTNLKDRLTFIGSPIDYVKLSEEISKITLRPRINLYENQASFVNKMVRDFIKGIV